VFLFNDEIYVSDTGNGRVMIYDQSTWQFRSSINTFSYRNGTQANFSYIYQTVVSNGAFYSTIDNYKIIRYNQSGIINETITLPVGYELSPTNIAISIDNTVSTPKVLVKFFSLYSIETLAPPQVYTFDDLRTPDNLTPLFNCTNESVHFSYSNGHPVLIGTHNNITTQLTQLVIAQFGENDSSYGITKMHYINAPATYGINSQAWANFSKGMWFAKGYSDEANIITDHNVSFAGYFNSLTTFDNLSEVNNLAYDSKNDLVIVTASEQHVVFGVKFLVVEKQITINETETTTPAYKKWLFDLVQSKYLVLIIIGTSVIIIAIVVFFIISQLRKKQNKK
jgi:hypothetical protein